MSGCGAMATVGLVVGLLVGVVGTCPRCISSIKDTPGKLSGSIAIVVVVIVMGVVVKGQRRGWRE